MVEIENIPIKKIIIHEIIKNSYEQYLSIHGGQSSRWADGVLFNLNEFPKIPEIIKEQMEGTVRWGSIDFTKMAVFRDKILDPRTNTMITVVDNSSTEAVCDAIKWLKKQPIYQDK